MSPEDKINFLENTGQVPEKDEVDGVIIEAFTDNKDKDKCIAIGGQTAPWYGDLNNTADQSAKTTTEKPTFSPASPPPSTTQSQESLTMVPSTLSGTPGATDDLSLNENKKKSATASDKALDDSPDTTKVSTARERKKSAEASKGATDPLVKVRFP